MKTGRILLQTVCSTDLNMIRLLSKKPNNCFTGTSHRQSYQDKQKLLK